MSSEMTRQTVDIVTAYLKKNEVAARDVPGLIRNVFVMLQDLSEGSGKTTGVERRNHLDVLEESSSGERTDVWEPAVPLEEAVTRDEVVCLICGKRCKAIKGHLTRSHKIRLEEYRKAFNLPKDFRMVAPSYSERRRILAIEAGLGDKLHGTMPRKENGSGEETSGAA
ncbi:MAG: MucR family transcriptional regulator [Magnetococcales bacterium]|nr:MucR family transcriptional regulator [Magnetococcales bacterium]